MNPEDEGEGNGANVDLESQRKGERVVLKTSTRHIEKDGEVERASTEISEFHKSKRQLMALLEQKDSEISKKNSTIQSYLDKFLAGHTDQIILCHGRKFVRIHRV